MIGFYDYTVIVTYLGLLFAALGIFQAIDGFYINALFCLGGTLLCDTLDGKIARTKKNRTKREALFGMQIDSLCDLVSFGVLPIVICYTMGLRDWLGILLMGYYCLCTVIRLAYFNVMELGKQAGQQTVYRGLPAVGLAIWLPTSCMLRPWVPEEVFFWILRGMLPIIGTLYILDFKVQKPKLWQIAILCLIFWVPVAVICLKG